MPLYDGSLCLDIEIETKMQQRSGDFLGMKYKTFRLFINNGVWEFFKREPILVRRYGVLPETLSIVPRGPNHFYSRSAREPLSSPLRLSDTFTPSDFRSSVQT
jgi:hypothetical protein